jgi:prevent-host-death family protein
MQQVSVTTFRKYIPDYLDKVRKGEEISLTSRGHVIARIVPPVDERMKAREQLEAIRKNCTIGDITTPLDTEWEADSATA